MTTPLTNQQQKVLDYIVVFYLANDTLPVGSVIAKAFGYASNNAASEMVQQLVRKGYLERNENNTYRFARNLPHPGWSAIVQKFRAIA